MFALHVAVPVRAGAPAGTMTWNIVLPEATASGMPADTPGGTHTVNRGIALPGTAESTPAAIRTVQPTQDAPRGFERGLG